MRKIRWLALAGLMLGIGASGCTPFLIGSAPIPVPVPPWVAESLEAKYSSRLKERTPIMPPIIPGQPLPTCEDPPTAEEILRALPRVTRGIPYIYEEFRDDYTFVIEKLVDKIDPPVYIPLVGPAQVHHCHYKCTVFYRERIQSSYPFPYYNEERRVKTVYIDKDHLHLYVGNDPAAIKAAARELMGP
jgi:hypothetical protein